jgi:hypothetical protein
MTALRTHGPWLLLVVGLCLVGLWPVTGEGAIGHATGDMADHYWGTWWFGSGLLTGRWPDTTDISHFPNALPLWYVDPVGALMSLPLRVLGFPAAWNGLLLTQVLLAALATYAMAWSATRTAGAAAVAALVVGTSPYLRGLAYSGLSEYIGLALPVLATWALVRAWGWDPSGRAGTRRDAVLAGLLVGACALQAFYYAAFAALLAVCLLPGPGIRQRLPRAILAGVVSGVVLVPLLAVAWDSLGGGAVSGDNAPGWNYRSLPVQDLVTFFRPGQYYFPDTRKYGNPGILHVNYLGWVALVLAWQATRSAWGDRRGVGRAVLWLAFGALLYFLFCLGPILTVSGRNLGIAGTPIYLPSALLYAPGSPWRMVHHPYRLVALLLPLLALLSAVGAARLTRRGQLFCALGLVAEVCLLSPAPWPLPSTPVAAPAIYAQLPPGPVLDWPADASRWNRSYELWQVEHQRPIPYGVNVFLDDELRRDPLVVALLRALDDPTARSRNRDVPFQGQVLLPPNQGASRLNEVGFVALIVHSEALSSEERTRTATLLGERLGPPDFTVDGDAAWLLAR